MDKYIRVENKDKNQPQTKDQIRVRAGDHSIFPYLSYAHRHFNEGNTAVIIKATGNAISRAVQVVELIKRRFKGLHQQNEIATLEVQDVYEPIEQGLEAVTRIRRLTMLVCTLSKEAIDKTHYGYQEPLPVEQIQQFQPTPMRGAPRQFRQGPRHYNNRGGYYRGRGGGNPRDYERGPRYRGGGRGGRGGYGYGGGYNNNRNYNQRREDDYRQDYDDDFEEQRPRGRGYRGGRGGYRPRGGFDGQRRDGDNRRGGYYGPKPRDGGDYQGPRDDYGPRPRDDYGPRPRDGEDFKEQPRNEYRYHQGGYQGERRYYNEQQRQGPRNDDRYRDGHQGGYYNRGPRGGARGYYRGRGRGAQPQRYNQ